MAVRVGFHVSIAGGISNSVNNAKRIGCGAFQIFSRNPRAWTARPMPADEVQSFKNNLMESGIDKNSVVVHMPYLPNLSGPQGEFYDKSVEVLKEQVNVCEALDIPYLVVHLGSHMGKGPKSGVDQLVKAIFKASIKSGSGLVILLENSAGQKNSVGSRFEELRLILDKLGNSGKYGICIDTCHLFASGYDLRKIEDVEGMFQTFKDIVGPKEIKLVHLNDCKGTLGSKLDRHEHIGLGTIGIEGIASFLKLREIRALPIIMETPIDYRRTNEENLEIVMKVIRRS
jgi:deoxyribonuclease-4